MNLSLKSALPHQGIFSKMERVKAHIKYLFMVALMLPALLKAQDPFEVKRVNTLSSYSEDIVSAVVKDGIFFCSNRKTNPFITRKNLQGEKLYDLYYSAFNYKDEPVKPEIFSPELRGKYNIGPACLSPDGKTLYFTRNYVEGKSKKKKGESDKYGIFMAHKAGRIWNNVTGFEYNNPRYRLAYPFVSPDGRYLFFSSDMEGTLGKSDIYVSENIDGKWSTPVNLGTTVNSSASEIYPFMHSSGRLYFSSDRGDGMGGLDIYYTMISDGQWIKPVLLAEPVNSASDDFAFYSASADQSGYFSSDRVRKGDDDIYSFRSSIIRWTACDSLQKNSYCYEFVEETALKIDSLPMEFKWEWDFDDGTRAEGITAVHCFEGPGSYLIQLNFVNKITGKVEKNQASYVLDIKDVEQPYISAPDTVFAGEMVKLDASLTNLPGWKISEYYWNFGDETIARGSDVTKKFSRQGQYNVQLIISSVPDGNGVVKEACVCKDIIVKERNN